MFNVLIVDDEKSNREGMKYLIDWHAYNFHISDVAKNGMEALEIIENKSIDLAIVDIRMPIMSGIDLIQKVRREQKREVEFIILSGYAEFEYAKKAIYLGARGYLLKPVEEEELCMLLEELRDKLAERKKEEIEELDTLEVAKRKNMGVMGEILDYVDMNYTENLNIKVIANKFYLNAAYLGQLFKKTTGTSFKRYLQEIRIRESKKLLKMSGLRIYEIAHKVGYEDPNYFVIKFQEVEGISPTAYRKHEQIL